MPRSACGRGPRDRAQRWCRPSSSRGTEFLGPLPLRASRRRVRVRTGAGTASRLERADARPSRREPASPGYHRLTVEAGGGLETCTVIAAPVQAWRRPGSLGAGASGRSSPRSARRAAARWATCGTWSRCAAGWASGAETWSPSSPCFPPSIREPAGAQPLLAGEPAVLVRADPRPGGSPSPDGRPATLDVTRGDAEVRARSRGAAGSAAVGAGRGAGPLRPVPRRAGPARAGTGGTGRRRPGPAA